MSYSFSVHGATAELAVAAIGPEFDKVVASQPVHAKDRDVAIAAATAVIGLCAEPPEGHELAVNVSGSLQWPYREGADAQTEPSAFSGASVSVNVHTPPKPSTTD